MVVLGHDKMVDGRAILVFELRELHHGGVMRDEPPVAIREGLLPRGGDAVAVLAGAVLVEAIFARRAAITGRHVHSALGVHKVRCERLRAGWTGRRAFRSGP